MTQFCNQSQAAVTRLHSMKNCADLLFILVFLTGLLLLLENILPSSYSGLYDEEKTQEQLFSYSGAYGTPRETISVDDIENGRIFS